MRPAESIRMSRLFTDRAFLDIDFTASPPGSGAYKSCVFRNRNLAGTNLSGLIDCSFEDRHLNLAKRIITSFQEVRFKGRKCIASSSEPAAICPFLSV